MCSHSPSLHLRCLISLCVVMLSLTFSACDKLPTPPQFGENSQDQSEIAPPDSVQPLPGFPTAPVEVAANPPLPAPAPKTPEEILEEFRLLQPREITDEHLQAIAEHEAARTQIVSLDASYSRVSNTGLLALRDYSELQILTLTRTLTSGSSLRVLEGHPKLHSLTLDETQFDPGNAVHLTRLPALTSLALRGVSLSDSIYETLKEIETLEHLHLDGNGNLLGRNFAELVNRGHLKKLRTLTVGDTNFGNFGLLSIDKLPELSLLDVRAANVNLNALDPISRSKSLRNLELSRNRLTDDALSLLKRSKSIAFLDLSHCDGITDQSVATLRTMRQLEYLKITKTRITPQGAENLRKVLKETKIVYESADGS